MAVSLLKMHQIFMLAFAGLRVEGGVAQVLVVSQPPPLACVAHNIFGETPGRLQACPFTPFGVIGTCYPNVANLLRGKTRQSVTDVAARSL